jgi:hypothetical protein
MGGKMRRKQAVRQTGTEQEYLYLQCCQLPADFYFSSQFTRNFRPLGKITSQVVNYSLKAAFYDAKYDVNNKIIYMFL